MKLDGTTKMMVWRRLALDSPREISSARTGRALLPPRERPPSRCERAQRAGEGGVAKGEGTTRARGLAAPPPPQLPPRAESLPRRPARPPASRARSASFSSRDEFSRRSRREQKKRTNKTTHLPPVPNGRSWSWSLRRRCAKGCFWKENRIRT